MTLRSWSILMVMWLISLVTVAAIAQPAVTVPSQLEPVIIAGENIGFRIDGYKDQGAVGTLVVRVNSRWVEAKFSPQHQILPLGSR